MQTMEQESNVSRFLNAMWKMRPGAASLAVMFVGAAIMAIVSKTPKTDSNAVDWLIVTLFGFCILVFGLKWWCDDVDKR